jgi:hypothetical protein
LRLDDGAQQAKSGRPESKLIEDPDRTQYQTYALSVQVQIAIILILLGIAGGAVLLLGKARTPAEMRCSKYRAAPEPLAYFIPLRPNGRP